MGFNIYYRSTEPIASDHAEAIRSSADGINKGRTWLSCEPVNFYDDDGRLSGSSKLTFEPHPDDVADAASEGLPEGTLRDVLDALCEISRTHSVDWECSHDEEPRPIGFIRSGVADDGLVRAFGGLADGIAAIMGKIEFDTDEFSGTNESPNAPDDAEDDDDPPHTIKLWPE